MSPHERDVRDSPRVIGDERTTRTCNVSTSTTSVRDQDSKEDRSCRTKTLLDISDFSLKRRLGDGSYSDVVLVQRRLRGSQREDSSASSDGEDDHRPHILDSIGDEGSYFALKIVDKYHIMKHSAVGQLQLERRLLEVLNDEDCTVNLYFTFQDTDNVYLGLEPCLYGELYDAIDHLAMEDIVFYAAEIVVMLDTLRRYRVVHRDLKPENLLIGYGGHLKLIDFGSACCLDNTWDADDSRDSQDGANGCGRESSPSSPTPTTRMVPMVGTAEYVAVEVLENKGPITPAIDLWAFGCIVYQMCTGKTPFRGASEYLTFQNILQGDVEYGDFDKLPLGNDARDLVEGLLQPDPERRLGFTSIQEIRSHPFFKSINHWDELYDREETPYFTRKICPSLPEGSTPTFEDTDEEDWELTSLAARAAKLNV